MTEMRREDVRLDRAAGFACEQEQRRGGRDRFGRRAYRRRIGRVEHVEPRPAGAHTDDRAQHFGRQARSAHAEQDDVGRSVALHSVRERAQASRGVQHRLRCAHPAEPIGDCALYVRVGRPSGWFTAIQRAGGALSGVHVCGDDRGQRSGAEDERVLQSAPSSRHVDRHPGRILY